MDGGQQQPKRREEEEKSFDRNDVAWGSVLFDNMCEIDSDLPYHLLLLLPLLLLLLLLLPALL